MHASAKFQLYLFKFCLHLLALGLAKHDELPSHGLVTYMRKAQKIESLRLAFPTSFAVLRRKASELN